MSDQVRLWVVGHFWGKTPKGVIWSIEGVFDSEEKAVAACRTEASFIGPITLNEQLPEKVISWPGCYYPKAEGRLKGGVVADPRLAVVGAHPHVKGVRE